MANILITGASDGLGRALARELAGAGHRLVVHGRDAGRELSRDWTGSTPGWRRTAGPSWR